MTAPSVPTPHRIPVALPPADSRQIGASRRSPSLVDPARSGPATYSELTRSAATALAQALVSCADEALTIAALHESVAAHRHVTARLVLLGRAITAPLYATRSRATAQDPGRRATADARLLRQLESVAQPRDWSAPVPAAGSTAGWLHRAADLVGAAAELWATHHDPAGSARGPEASRLRHPATLGAAVREWRELVLVAGAMADELVGAATSFLPAGEDRARLLVGLPKYPQPAWRRDRRPRHPLTLTVARPHPRSVDDLQALRERVRHLRHTAWRLGRAGIAPVPVVANLAAIGVLLHQAASEARRGERAAPEHGPVAAAPVALPSPSQRTGTEAWREVGRAAEPLRSPHPAQTAVQVERLDVRRLLERLVPAEDARRGSVNQATVQALADLAAEFDLMAPDLLRAVRGAAGRNELYVRGRALTNDLLPRSPELLEAKLRDGIAPAPTAMLRRLEAALCCIGRPPQEREDDAPPAA